MKSNSLEIIKTAGGLIYISFPNLCSERSVAAFTTRMGGVSRGRYASMNMSFTNGDDPASVRKNYDILLSAVVSVMVGFVVMLSDWFTRITFWGGTRDRDDDSKGNTILMLIGLIFLILSPIFGKLMQLAISRKREFLADATAIQFTRNPDGLISALQKISGDPNQLNIANKATENMYIVNPFRNKKKASNLWSTHPSIEDRVEALRNLK